MSHESHAILVISEISSNADALKGLLASEHHVQVAGAGIDPYDLIRETEPSLVLLDLEGTDLDIPNLLNHLQEDPVLSRIPVLLASPDSEHAEAGIKAGAMECIIKPFHPLLVQNRVRNCLDFSRCKDSLHHFSLVDAITGIANRRRFEEFLNMEWRRNLRNQTPLTIILMNLDLFTSFSEHYGASATEACLRKVASALSPFVQRPGDLFARFGRDGFACVLPETDMVGAVSVAERLRAEVFALAIPHEASGPGSTLTASLGVATGVPLNGAEPEDLLVLAERHLFDAKRSGRNRLVFGS